MKINFIKRNGGLIPFGEEDRELIDSFKDGAVYSVDIKNMDKRTLQQNASMWLWCVKIADTLNNNDMPISKVIKTTTKWNKDSVKSILFNSVMESECGKKSSNKLKRDDYNKIIDTLTLLFGEKFGITLPEFPNKDN